MRRPGALLALLLPALAAAADAPGRSVEGLTLTGVVMDRLGSVALISRDGRGDRAFQVGDHVTPDAVLTAIEADQVRLKLGTQVRVLTFTGLVHDDQRVRMPVPALPAHADAFLTPMPGITYLNDYHFIVTRQKIHDFLASPNALSEARWMLQKDGGLFVARIKEGSAYEKAGLHVGDVIMSINGTPLANGDDVLAVYQKLDKLDHLDLHIQRMGQDQHLLYDIKP